MNTPALVDGWLKVPCDAPDLAVVEIAIGDQDTWLPAFRDWHNGLRVAQVRSDLPDGSAIWLRVNGRVAAKHFYSSARRRPGGAA